MSCSNITSTLPFVLLFFSAMVGHELALEALATSYQRFPHMATSVTLFQFGFCVLLPLSLSLGGGGDVIKNFPRKPSEVWVYIKLSAVVYGATACATASLRYEGVTYVTKVVFKSAKLIPTMIVGVVMDAMAEKSGGKIVQKRKYGVWQYGSALLLCLGAAGFCMSPKDLGLDYDDEDGNEDEGYKVAAELTPEEEASEEFIRGSVNLGGHWVGISLLALSVFCDALVPNLQQKLMHGTSGGGAAPSSSSSLPRKYSDEDDDLEDLDIEMKPLTQKEGNQIMDPPKSNKPHPVAPNNNKGGGGLSSQALMVNTNCIGFTLLLLSTIFRQTFVPIISFLFAHPHFSILHLTVGTGLGTAVLAYMELIRRSGPAVAVAVATLRKVVTVILSYVIFPKPMTGLHAISAGMVMSGLLVGYVGKGK